VEAADIPNWQYFAAARRPPQSKPASIQDEYLLFLKTLIILKHQLNLFDKIP
jgi:hypothetical protein